MRLSLKVVPKSSRSRILGFQGDVLRVAVAAPAERGRANEAALDLLATALGIPSASLRLVVGAASPRKILEIDGIDDVEALRKRLARS